jgi:WD40 repeat protein
VTVRPGFATEVRVRDGRQLGVVRQQPAFDEAFYLADGRVATTRIGRIWIRAEARAKPMLAFNTRSYLEAPLELSRDSGTLVTVDRPSSAGASGSPLVRLWDTRTARQLAVLRHSAEVRFASLDGPATRVVTVTADGRVRLWDVGDASQLRVLGHDPPVTHARLSEDGAILATAANDGSVSLWSAGDGTLLDHLQLPEEGDTYISSLSPDGRLIAVDQAGRGYVYVCEVCIPPADLRALAARRTVRALTLEERARLLGQ